MEQEEYTKEEINWSYVEFVDNQDVLDLIEKVCVCVCVCKLSLLSHYEGLFDKIHNLDNFFFFYQKPGGIIALLDEAW